MIMKKKTYQWLERATSRAQLSSPLSYDGGSASGRHWHVVIVGSWGGGRGRRRE